MNAIIYLYRKTAVNRIKRALKKPVTYIYLVLAAVYFGSIFGSLDMFVDMFGSDKASLLAGFLTITAFIFVPSSLISYSKRKGLIFRQPDIHLLFPSPIGAKRILLYAHMKTIFISLLLNIILAIGGVLWFDMPVWKMTVYFLFSGLAENILEGSLMILCYGNQKLNRKQMSAVSVLMYALVASFVLIGIAMYVRHGAGAEAVLQYLNGPAIQMVPVIGWYIAFIHLLFVGPATVSIIGAALYFVSAAALLLLAVRMKCTGEYYEDAIRFAEDYEEARAKGKRGEVALPGYRKKFGKATVSYKGSYARALFYRQLLEYKKNRFFIFGFYTLLSLLIGIGIAVFSYIEDFGAYGPFVILGIMAYITFIFASYAGKWGKELEKPYTYLIPDSSFHKLWYATLIEHIRALVDGCLLTIPAGIVMRLSIVEIVLIVGIYVCMQACKLYSAVMVEAFMGNILGAAGKQFARLFFEGIVIALGITGAAIGVVFVSVEFGFLVLIAVSATLTAGMMAIASINFNRMETAD